MDIQRFRARPLMGILRGIAPESLDAVIEASIESGFTTLEITMNTKGAADLIAQARATAGERMMIGAGTVLGLDSLEQALTAGAGFVVMPTRVDQVIRACVDEGIPVFPGALTPQEIHDAWRAGASMVKVDEKNNAPPRRRRPVSEWE
jgi:2-dehydro-3-deoxyphosphogluconate aldolase/(4S)-4-hydroxy-2-oxoglutarate aldolase